MKKFMIIDGNALVHRAFHALPPLTAKDGTMVNAVYGFTTILLKALKDLKPEYAAVAFDRPEPTFRHKMYNEYKATREKKPQELYDQIPLIKQVVDALGIQVIEKAGFEADDIIATLAERAHDKKNRNAFETMIVTGDMDTLQLIDDHTKVYSFRKGVSDIFIFDAAAVRERYGLTPEQMNDYKALRGDPSDNIPGVRGIGEKTATELLQKFGNIETLYEAVEHETEQANEIRARVRDILIEYKKDAIQGKLLVNLVRDMPIPQTIEDCKRKTPDIDTLKKLFDGFGFQSLIKRLPELQGTAQGSLLPQTPVVPVEATGSKLNEISLQETVAEARKTKMIALALSDEALALSAIAGTITFTTPTDTAPLLEDASVLKIGHNIKSAMRALYGSGITLHGPLFDTMLAAYLLEPGARVYTLEAIANRFLTEKSESTVSANTLLALAPILKKHIHDQGLDFIADGIEMLLIPILAHMEALGILVDRPYLEKLSARFAKKLETLEKEIHKLSESDFNINSPIQLREILYTKMGLSPERGRIKKTSKGAVSTAAGELEKLRGLHPIVDLIFEYRELSKLKSTYTDAIPELIDPTDGRIHSSFNQTITATGRLSSSNPNLQNIPVRTETGREIRNAFIAQKGFTLVAADYSQIELRLAASLSNDTGMINAFKGGEDFHKKTAALIFNVAPEKITSTMRRNAKTINFGILYGMGSTSLAQATGMKRAEAEQFINRYFEVFPRLAQYLEELKNEARAMGHVATLFGRRRPIPEIMSNIQQVRAGAERMALNMPIQGTAADLMKLAMIKVANEIKDAEARMLLQVHDELIFEVPEGTEKKLADRLKQIMENVHHFKVPIVVDIKSGKNWGEMYPVL